MSGVVSRSGFGVGQTWQDVTATRALGVAYKNDTGRPIMVNVTKASAALGDGYVLQASADGVGFLQVGFSSEAGAATVSAVVPPNWWIKATQIGAGALSSWVELR